MRSRWLLVASAVAVVLSCAEPPHMEMPIPPMRGRAPMVRVRISQGEISLCVEAENDLEIRKGARSQIVTVIESGERVTVEAKSGVITMAAQGNHRVVDQPVLFRPIMRRGWVTVEGKPYRGELEVWADAEGLVAVNRLQMEDYLRGVIPGELGRVKEIEAAKAQAVAARTYALSQLDGTGEYDLKATVSDQLYQGMAGEDELINQAIQETQGVVMLHEGEPIKAYYHSTCGGHTEPVEKVWEGKSPRPYLVGVRDGNPPFCSWANHFRWRERWTGKELEQILAQSLPPLLHLSEREVGRLRDIRILKRTKSGRAECMEIETDKGIYHIYQDDIRRALRRPTRGHPILKSSAFQLQIRRNRRGEIDSAEALGYGYGHGVGMCQCGAIGMARAGYRWNQILRHYYPGVEIRRIY